MLHATFARVNEEDLPRLRAWLDSLSSRRAELCRSYREEGTRHELFFLVRVDSSPILVLISELEDLEAARASFFQSNLPLDVEFKSLVQEISQREARVELLYDSSRYVDVAAA